jgi:hypothetical protein
MATPWEREILTRANGDVDRLKEEIQRRHKAGEEIAAPHDPLLDEARKVVQRHGNVEAAFGEVIRGHAYAHFLSAKKRGKHWTFFIGEVAKY